MKNNKRLTPDILTNKYGFRKLTDNERKMFKGYYGYRHDCYHHGQFIIYNNNSEMNDDRYIILGMENMFGLKTIKTEKDLIDVVNVLFSDPFIEQKKDEKKR